MKTRINTIGIACSLVLLLWTSSASANGLLIESARLSPDVRRVLQKQVHDARQRSPQHFAAVTKLRTELIQRDARKRGRMSGITPALRALGQDALYPILERLMLQADTRSTMTASAHTAWSVNLLEALGSLRSPAAEPALREVSQKSSTMNPLILRSATAALAKIGSDSAAKHLITLSRGKSIRAVAALAGMGHCRRLACASELERRFDTSRTLATRHLLARALGDIGNGWAWQTPRLKKQTEGRAIRQLAMTTLLTAFVRYADPGLRKHITQAILVVDHPDTLPHVRAQLLRQREAATRSALTKLRLRVEQSPFRSKAKAQP